VTESLKKLEKVLDQCTAQEQAALLDYLKARVPQHPLEKEWGVGAEVILSAIARSSDLTKRGVRGIIAEAIFERHVLAQLNGWEAITFTGDLPYDFLIRSKVLAPHEARIQVKLQRMKTQRPMMASEANRHYPADHFVVEVQKTRGGVDLQTGENTRPYRFGEFDILAVNMHPSTRDWNAFLFTLSKWLLPRHADAGLIEIFQPVTNGPNEYWTGSLEECLQWLALSEDKRILDISPDLLKRRTRKQIPPI
jgi:hypothetical protein